MASAWNGCGTKYYGDWWVKHEGEMCKIQTEFLVAMYIPIFPVESVLVLAETKKENMIFYQSKELRIIKVGKFWPQIFNIYSFVAAVIAGLLIMLRLYGNKISLYEILSIYLILFVFPVLTMYFTNKQADSIRITKTSIISAVIIMASLIINIFI